MRRNFIHQPPQSPRPPFISSMRSFNYAPDHQEEDFDVQEYLWTHVDPDAALVLEIDGARLYQPVSYVHSYAYPLIIWLHDNGQTEIEATQIISEISDRNYIGAGLRGTFPVLNGAQIGYRWSMTESHIDQTLEEIYSLCMEIRSVWNIHTERIFLAGTGAGAAVATQLVLKRPEWFGGLISIAPEDFTMHKPLANFRQLRHLKALLVDEPGNKAVHDHWHSLLASAGVKSTRNTHQNASTTPQALLREIDHFLISNLKSTHAI